MTIALEPPCVTVCPTQAILFGDLNDAGSEIAKRLATYASKEVRADLALNTGSLGIEDILAVVQVQHGMAPCVRTGVVESVREVQIEGIKSGVGTAAIRLQSGLVVAALAHHCDEAACPATMSVPTGTASPIPR
mgnify:CR=1 FL=1